MLPPTLAVHSAFSHDCIDDNFPQDEVIGETVSCPESPWEELHYRPSSIQDIKWTEHDEYNA